MEVKNAALYEIYYNSFEEGNEGILDNQAKTGVKSFSGNYTVNFALPSGTSRSFVITYWVFNGSKWTWHSAPYNGGSIQLNGLKIDEVRIHPSDAFMTTYTYQPQVGVSSQTDLNNRTTFYHYDDQRRLFLVKDDEGNILKKFCYNYYNEVEDCGIMDTSPKWEASSETRCKPCAANAVYVGNEQQLKEVDKNPYSLGFNTAYRWVDVGTGGSCVSQPDWQFTGGVRCEADVILANGDTIYSGYQIKEERDMNPCSATPANARTRWVFKVQNCTSCPTPANWQPVTGYTCQTSNGQNTGYQTRTEKDMNNCSATYNQTRTTTVYNTTSCPLPYVCSSSNCDGIDRKCINNACVVGTYGVSSSVWTKVYEPNSGTYVWMWECKWRYFFPDGSQSAIVETTYSSESCYGVVEID